MELTIVEALQQGITAHKAGKLDEAERLYRAILQSQPSHPDANHNLGVLAVSVNKVDVSLPFFKTALEANPKIEQFWLSYIDALIKDKQRDVAFQVLEDAKKHGVTSEQLNVFASQLIPEVQSTNLTSPSKEQLDNLLGYYQKGRIAEAEKLGLSLTEAFPSHSFSWKVLGALFGQTGRHSEALRANQKAVELSPGDAAVYSNLGSIFREIGRFGESEASYAQAIRLQPDYAEAHFNLGNTLQEWGRLEEAEASYKQAIKLKPKNAKAHYNLGITLQNLNRLEEAEACYADAISSNRNYVEAYNNLGNTLKNLGRLEEAEENFFQVIKLKPDFAAAYYNLGNTLLDLGRLEEAEESFAKAITLNPNYVEAYNNLGILLEESGKSEESALVFDLMIKNKSEPISCVSKPPMIALVIFGRSGSLFFHSLIDGHPEIATLPGVYFKGWFGIDVWQQFAPDYSQSEWRELLVSKVTKEFEPLFDAQCRNNVIGNPFQIVQNANWLALNQGFTNMGPEGSQSLLLNKEAFCQEFLSLLEPLSSLGVSECFELIHIAFEKSVRDDSGSRRLDNKTIFYHIHNANLYERLHFLKHYPEARIVQLIRNPVQSMESWLISSVGQLINNNANQQRIPGIAVRQWREIVRKIISMFRQILYPLHLPSFNYGIRLEDIKRNPEEVMPKIAAWMGVSDHAELYNSSFCGLQYWGPPSVTGKITGFDTKSIDTSVGRLLGPRDIIIFETLFWPLSTSYSYTQMSAAEFRLRLSEIRPWLDEPLELEKRIYEQMEANTYSLEKMDPYIRLHQFMHVLWKILDRDETYMGIPKHLELT